MNQNEQQHEGPWRKANEYTRTERDVNELVPELGSRSWLDYLQERYGAQNVSIDRTAYAEEDDSRYAVEVAEFNVASEGMRRAMQGLGYTTADGVDITGKVRRMAVSPFRVDILISPDGDNYAQALSEQLVEQQAQELSNEVAQYLEDK